MLWARTKKTTNNSISSPHYEVVKKFLDDMLAGKMFITDEFKAINDLSLSICALLVAIKDAKYREKSLLMLSQLINIHTLGAMFNVLKSKEVESYEITSLDISSQQRKEIISYMFAKLPDPRFYNAIIFSIGFYLIPDVLDVLDQYALNDDTLIKREVMYAIDFKKFGQNPTHEIALGRHKLSIRLLKVLPQPASSRVRGQEYSRT